MSKHTLKKHLLSLSREQLAEIILEKYDNMIPLKENLEYFPNPIKEVMLKNYKDIIRKDFT